MTSGAATQSQLTNISGRRISAVSLSKLNLPDRPLEGALSCPVDIRADPPLLYGDYRDDDVEKEGKELFENFVLEEIEKEGLEAPGEVLGHTEFCNGNPMWTSAGRELRLMADEFARTNERERVRENAQKIEISNITYDKFRDLLIQLFHRGSITKERITVLFFFCADVAIRSLRETTIDRFKILFTWSLRYIIDNVCQWVQRHGGWGAVLQHSVFTVLPKIVMVIGCAAICWGIYKAIKNS